MVCERLEVSSEGKFLNFVLTGELWVSCDEPGLWRFRVASPVRCCFIDPSLCEVTKRRFNRIHKKLDENLKNMKVYAEN